MLVALGKPIEGVPGKPTEGYTQPGAVAQPVAPADGERLVDALPDARFGDTPEEQKASAASGLDLEEEKLNKLWNEEFLVDTAGMTPEEKAAHQTRLYGIQSDLADIGAKRVLEAADQETAAKKQISDDAARRQALAERDAQIRQKAIDSEHKWRMDKLDAADEEAAKRPIDRSWGNGSTGSLVMTAISVALAGLGSALKGDGANNPALNIVLRQIDQRVADQWKKKGDTTEWADKQRGRLDVYKQSRVLTVAEQQQAAKISLAKEVADGMKQVASTLPAAKKAALEMTSAQLAEQAVAARKALDETLYKRTLDDRKQKEIERSALATEKIQRAGVGAQYARIKLDRDQFIENKTRYYAPEAVDDRKLDRDKKQAEIDKLKKEAEATGNADAIKDLDRRKKELDLAEAEDARNIQAIRPSVVKDEKTGLPVIKDGKVVVSYGTFKQPDGTTSVHLKGSSDGKFKASGAVASYEAAARATDALIKEVSANGWSSTTLRGDNYKTAQSLYTALMLEGKDTYNLGALQPAEIKLMGGLFGGDPTALIGDPVVSLRAARDLLGQKAFTQFKAHSDYRGLLRRLQAPGGHEPGHPAGRPEHACRRPRAACRGACG